jgi:hypothetical protein
LHSSLSPPSGPPVRFCDDPDLRETSDTRIYIAENFINDDIDYRRLGQLLFFKKYLQKYLIAYPIRDGRSPWGVNGIIIYYANQGRLCRRRHRCLPTSLSRCALPWE